MKRALGTCLCGLVLLGAGCGESSSDDSSASADADARRQLDTLMDDYRAAFKAGDGAAACKLLTASLQKQYATFVAFGGPGSGKPAGNCKDGFHLMTQQDVTEDVTPKIDRVTIGDRTARIRGWVSHQNEFQTAMFVKEGDEWKIKMWFWKKRHGG